VAATVSAQTKASFPRGFLLRRNIESAFALVISNENPHGFSQILIRVTFCQRRSPRFSRRAESWGGAS
jgi:hypothetical protein